ncbi:hypothetical protein [Nocardia brasiliensis]|uniref:hypothetical protein n=1 Tax=Nocardia brasiliensis TaxID=37326 RepID=UPI0024589BED|nr:hypothetical protein [Nocardia brasiliensis]
MSGFLTEEQIGEALLSAFEDHAAEQYWATSPRVSSDGATDEVRLEGFFDLEDIAERLLSRAVVVELPDTADKATITPGYVEWPVADRHSVVACHEPRMVSLGDDERELWLTPDESLYLAARLITAAHSLGHPSLVNRSPS